MKDMTKHFIFIALFSVLCGAAIAQGDTSTFIKTEIAQPAFDNEAGQEVYFLKPKIDIPLTVVTAGWTVYAFSKIYNKEDIPLSTVRALRREDINGFDRRGADIYSEKAADLSDKFFYGSMPLPLVLFVDKHIRQDAGKVGFLYLEAMSITGLLYTGSVYLFDRYRPVTYNTSLSAEERARGGNKNSFFAGHVALVATSTFFTAKTFADYHPDSKLKYVFYGAAIASTAATGYLRHRGGKHFPSDVLIGTAVGTLSGLLVPHFHKNPVLKNNRVSIMPFAGNSNGLALTYKL